ncbi:MAG: phospholipid carrier-dependent glycosyltransferase, partial [Phycisphaerae bacterium]|nr:phospholipid carrier-dependent glycosyltransferase [Phycisphaerae bacterium]
MSESSQGSVREPAGGGPGGWVVTLLWAACVAAAAVGPYVGTLGNDFVFDDRPIVLCNARDWRHDDLIQVLKRDYWGDQRIDSLYRPVTTISYVLNYRMGEDRPWSYRAINIALHAVCCVCLFGLTVALFGDRRLAGLAAILFAVHAVHVEPVAQVVGRAELLAGLLATAALWVYVLDRRDRRTTPTWRYVVVLALAALAMLSKESGIAVIGVMVFYDVWSLRFGRGAGGDRGEADRRRAG